MKYSSSSSPSPTSSPYPADSEWKVLQRRILSILPWILGFSAVYLLASTSRRSNPSIIILNTALNPSPPSLPMHNNNNNNNNNNITTSTASNVCNETTIHKESPTPILPQDQSTTNASCDLFDGRWVWEKREAAYTNATCQTLPGIRDCSKYGKDPSHLNWRWKPDGCELPRFDPWAFLGIVRGKKLAFVGDSLARNHMESMLCSLSQADTPVDTYKDEQDKSRIWHFASYNFTLMVIWSEFLVSRTERFIGGKPDGSDIHIDRVDDGWAQKLPDLHYVVISSSNWFFRKNYIYEGGKLIGCVSCVNEANSVVDLGVEFAVRRAFKTALRFISECEGCEKLVFTLLRTYSQGHFEHGNWNSGGYCNRTKPILDGSDLSLDALAWKLREIQLEEMDQIAMGRNKAGKRKYGVMDVTKAMMMRVDGHPGPHWIWGKNGNDCLHWCLPGPIDTWNDFLLEILKRDSFVRL